MRWGKPQSDPQQITSLYFIFQRYQKTGLSSPKETNMLKFAVILFSFLLQSCADSLTKQGSTDTGYFADASDCFRASTIKENVKVPTAGTMTVIDIPIDNDAAAFRLCMEQSGHVTASVKASDYLAVSRTCLQQARDSASPDAAYASCVKGGKITVETIPNK